MIREFRIKKGSSIRIWKIWQEGETYFTESGVLNGKMQTFSDTPGAKGKQDTKGFVNALDNCTFNVNREIRKKTEHGYVEYVNNEPVNTQVNKIDFTTYIPKNFCSYKPQTDIADAALNKLHKSGNAFYTRKYDGLMHICVHHTWGWEIYSRRMDVTSDRFPHHINALNSIEGFGVGTIIVGEMICSSTEGIDDFKSITRICRSDPPEARRLIEESECVEPNYRIFDILFYNERNLKDTTFNERHSIISNVINAAKSINIELVNFINIVDSFNLTPETWEDFAKKNNWEGFVVVDKQSIPGDKFFSFDGDAKRPKGHHKLKPIYTDEVVVYGAIKGSGKRINGIGAVLTKQIHPDTKQWFDTGKCGSGFSEQNLKDIEQIIINNNLPIFEKEKDAKQINIDNNKGIVIEIEFSERQPGSNKFRFPVFIRSRDDKATNECIAQYFNYGDS